VTLSATLTATPVLGSTPGAAASLTGPLLLEQVRAVPNPVRSGRLELKLLTQGPGDTLALRLYSSARVCVLEARLPGPAGPGWSGAGLDLGPLPPGLYHLRAHLEQGSRRSGPVIVNVWIGP
jgi:hypothetical protein